MKHLKHVKNRPRYKNLKN